MGCNLTRVVATYTSVTQHEPSICEYLSPSTPLQWAVPVVIVGVLATEIPIAMLHTAVAELLALAHLFDCDWLQILLLCCMRVA